MLVRHCCVLTNMYFYIHSCHWFHVLALWMQPLGLYNNTEACKSSQIHQCSRIFLQYRLPQCHNPRHFLSKKRKRKGLVCAFIFWEVFLWKTLRWSSLVAMTEIWRRWAKQAADNRGDSRGLSKAFAKTHKRKSKTPCILANQLKVNQDLVIMSTCFFMVQQSLGIFS